MKALCILPDEHVIFMLLNAKLKVCAANLRVLVLGIELDRGGVRSVNH